MDNPLLEVKNLHVSFPIYEGVLKVLNGLDFKLDRGEKIGVIGETRCGKTTTMKSILRLLPKTAVIPKGQILFKGTDILTMKFGDIQKVRRQSISMIFQDPTAALNPVFKIGEQLLDIIKYSKDTSADRWMDRSIGKSAKKEWNNEAVNVLKDVGLPDQERIMENYPIQLSGGMRQRVCIAMSLVSARDILIADEPGTSLDVTIEAQILELLKRLVEEKGTSIILVSHALGAVMGLVDRVYVMYAGSMVESAETQALFLDPLHPYTCGLLKAVPKLTGGGIPQGIDGRIPDYLNPPKGCRFFPRCKSAMSICAENRPSMFQVGGDHQVACFLYKGDEIDGRSIAH
jgi:peptide/nickel transport system ATP-binding protein